MCSKTLRAQIDFVRKFLLISFDVQKNGPFSGRMWHKADRADLGWVAASALRRLLAFLQAPMHRLRNLMTPWQKIEPFFAKVCRFSNLWHCFQGTLTKNMGFLCQGVTHELDILLYTSTAAGEYARLAAHKCCASYAQGLAPPFVLRFAELNQYNCSYIIQIIVYLRNQWYLQYDKRWKAQRHLARFCWFDQ